jgi:Na+/melibiose symporter-like transporter
MFRAKFYTYLIACIISIHLIVFTKKKKRERERERERVKEEEKMYDFNARTERREENIDEIILKWVGLKDIHTVLRL